MKRNLILSVVAIVLLALCCGLPLLLLLLVLPIAWFFIERRKADDDAEPSFPVYATVDDVVSRYGEPAGVVTLNAARGNELEGLCLFYPARDVAIITGRELPLSQLTAVAAKNMATPYTVDEWAVIINTTRRDWPTLTLRVGYDAILAGDIASQIDAFIHSSADAPAVDSL